MFMLLSKFSFLPPNLSSPFHPANTPANKLDINAIQFKKVPQSPSPPQHTQHTPHSTH